MADKVGDWFVKNADRFYKRPTSYHLDALAMLRAALADLECNEALGSWKIVKDCCDRQWENETPHQIAVIASNGMFWRNEEIRQLRAQLAAAQRDKERLDWLLMWIHQGGNKLTVANGTILDRGAIDAAMSSSQPPAQEKESQDK